MTSTFTTSNLKEVFSFPFKDENWVTKHIYLVLLTFFSFLLFPGIIIMGYVYEIMRRVIVQGEAPSMPEWDDWGEFLVNGLKMWGVSLIYSLPSLLFMGPYLFMMIAMPILTQNPDTEVLGIFLFLGSMFLMFLGIFVSLVVWIFLPPAWGHMVAKGEFGAAFRIKEFWPVLRNNLVGYFLSIVLYFGLIYLVSMFAQLLVITVVLCLLYPIVLAWSSVYMLLVGGGMFAQAYVEGAEITAAKAEANASAGELEPETGEESAEEENMEGDTAAEGEEQPPESETE